MNKKLVTVVEHSYYIKRAERVITTDQMQDITDILAINPKAGDVMGGTGGFRKLRYAGIQGKGKSGGFRIIQIYIKIDEKVHLVDIFGKNEKDNLSKEERNELTKLAEILKGKN